jgi:hypothetical protein
MKFLLNEFDSKNDPNFSLDAKYYEIFILI